MQWVFGCSSCANPSFWCDVSFSTWVKSTFYKIHPKVHLKFINVKDWNSKPKEKRIFNLLKANRDFWGTLHLRKKVKVLKSYDIYKYRPIASS